MKPSSLLFQLTNSLKLRMLVDSEDGADNPDTNNKE